MDGCCRLCQHCCVGHHADRTGSRPGPRSDRASHRRHGKAPRSAPDVKSENRVGDIALYRRLAAELRPYWRGIGGVLLLSFAATPLSLLTPLPLKIAVDTVIGSQQVP